MINYFFLLLFFNFPGIYTDFHGPKLQILRNQMFHQVKITVEYLALCKQFSLDDFKEDNHSSFEISVKTKH